MKNKPYKVRGDRLNGFNISVPAEVNAQAGDLYDFQFYPEINHEHKLPPGAMVFVPAVKK